MENIRDIEEIVSEAMGVDLVEIRGNSKCSEASTARHFVWYICRNEDIASMRELMMRYNRLKRAVFHGIAKIRFGINTQPYYKNIYAKICEVREKKRSAQ